jgi:hypothetical protein
MASKTITIPYQVWYDAYYVFLVESNATCVAESRFDHTCGLEFIDFIPSSDTKPGLCFRVRNRKRYTWAVLHYGF